MSHFTSTPLFTIDTHGAYQPASLETIVSAARECLDQLLARDHTMDSPASVRNFLSLKMGSYDREVFSAVFLDAQNRVIEYRELFTGTLTQTSVYPREVLRAALQLNAAAMIVAHNHPSGVAEPSRADEYLTQTLKTSLALVDVRLLDHMVVGGGTVVSLAERGLL